MLIDVNCSLGFWPFQMFAQDSPAKLARHLAAEGVSKALVSPVESVLFPDPHLVSTRMLGKLSRFPDLIPVPVIDPSLGNWRECLDAYVEAGHGHMVKIVPNYHRYGLDAPCVDELMSALSRPRRVLAIQMRVEDERQHYPLMKVPGVSVDSIVDLANRHPRARILCLCPYLAEAVRLVNETENVHVDLSFIEYLNTLQHVLTKVPAKRLLFGSHTPFLYTRANVMKLQCAEVPRGDIRLISNGNARRLLKL